MENAISISLNYNSMSAGTKLFTDKRLNTIIDILRMFPEGLGFNELKNKLVIKKEMSPVTLRKKLNKLLEFDLITQTPKEPRTGQKIIFRIGDSFEDYESLISRISEETTNTISILRSVKIETEKDLMNFNINYYNKIVRQYSLLVIALQLNSWNYNWLYNANLMKDLLLLIYYGFLQVYNEMNQLMQSEKFREIFIKTLNKYDNFKKPLSNEQFKSLFESSLTDLYIYNIFKDRNEILKLYSNLKKR
jgi:hypothetical protein